MWKLIFVSIFLPFLSLLTLAEDTTANEKISDTLSDSKKAVCIIPIEGPIGKPAMYIVRRGIKEAIANGIEVIVIDMNTPGGELNVTLEIMKMLDRYEGDTITFINNEAISAGAFISVITDKIYFQPDGQIGAAEVVSGTGQEIPEGMKRKIQSYINAKVRVYTEEYRYRGDIMRAMTDHDFELTIEGKSFSKKGDLLSLTAKEAIQAYGDPPESLLGEGLAESVEELLDQAYGVDQYEIKSFETTWSENLAKSLQGFVPVLMGLGMLLLFIEFKTPSFGLLGGLGIALIIIVFLSNYVAGLAGYEAILVFLLGVVLVAVELFVLPGTVVIGFMGIALMFASLVWSLADIWPTSDGGFDISWDVIIAPLRTVILSLLGSIASLALLWKFLPSRILENKLVMSGQSPSPSEVTMGGAIHAEENSHLPDIGKTGVVVNDLHPIGTVQIEGEFYEALAEVGMLDKGATIRVVGYKQFSLLVEEVLEV